MSHGPATAIAPSDPRRLAAWRTACIAYRQCRREGQYESICWHNARHQLWLLMPDLDYWAAAEATTQAIYYASWKFPAWLNAGVSTVRPKMPFVPPHIINGSMALMKMRKEGRL